MARLPIQRYVQMKAATVLTVNQVTDILVKQVRACGLYVLTIGMLIM